MDCTKMQENAEGELLLGFGWRWGRREGLGFRNCSCREDCSGMLQKLVCNARAFCGYGCMGHDPSHAQPAMTMAIMPIQVGGFGGDGS